MTSMRGAARRRARASGTWLLGLVTGAAIAAAGCLESRTTTCASGIVCPAGMACDDTGTRCVSRGGCGDGVLAPPEECDDGNAADGDGCSTHCTLERCGNGTLDPGEACDDGNTAGGDGCQGDCAREERCGDGTLDPQEVCDDGNTASGDGCRMDCGRIEACGDGVIDWGEECDDGGVADGDGCRADCTLPRCGDGRLDRYEACDEGPANSEAPDATCRTSCQPRRCGDGVTDVLAGEVCDDGNASATDACTPDCASDGTCGNGYVDVAKEEECDCGLDNTALPPGCGSINSTAPDAACRPGCANARCGDEIVDPGRGEGCDEGAGNSGAANATCRPDCRPARCGDGVVDGLAGEVCDDGNASAGDGCAPDCRSRELCGNGIVDVQARPVGEQCDCGEDGAALPPGCSSVNSTAPNAECRPGCVLRRCGDGTVDRASGEQCEEGVLDRDCRAFGFYDAPGLACDPSCAFDSTGCTGRCGDGEVNGLEACDGAAPDGQTCLSYGFDLGVLGCSGTCAPALGSCRRIGVAVVPIDTPAGLRAVWGAPDGELYVAGEGGTVRRFAATGWAALDTGVAETVTGGWAGAADVQVVTDAGAIRRRDGGAWTVAASAPVPLRAIGGSADGDLVAVGDGGTILEWDGASWAVAPSPTSADLHAVWGSGGGAVYAVGDGVVLRRDGAWGLEWLVDRSGAEALRAVWGTGDDVHAAGEGGTLLRRRDGAWSIEPAGTDAGLRGLAGDGPRAVHAVGDGGAWLHLDGERWTSVPSGVNVTLRASLAAGGSTWAVGDAGTVLRLDGMYWAGELSGSVKGLRAVWGDGPWDVRAVGEDGTILRFDGAWSAEPSGTSASLAGVWGPRASPPDLYAVGGGGLIRHQAEQGWTGSPSGVTDELTSIWGRGPYDVTVTTLDGRVLRWSGFSWDLMPPLPRAFPLRAAWGASRDDLYVVGDGGAIAHWDGTAWTEMASPVTRTLHAVWGSGPADVYAAGEWGTILHYDGAAWTSQDSGTLQHLYALAGGGPGDVFAAGTGGELLHGDGESWARWASRTTQTLRGAWAHPTAAFFVGDAGTVLHLVRTGAGCLATEDRCANARDDDCDGLADCADPDCVDVVAEDDLGACADDLDNDCDAAADCADPGCGAARPEAMARICFDGRDNDCDGLTDTDPECAATVPPDMVLVPAGPFVMGSDPGEGRTGWGGEAPEHLVQLSAYFIDLQETTNAEYRACMAAGACTSPLYDFSWTRPGYLTDPAFDDYPVTVVNWHQAAAYCAWKGRRLPTDAEWEKAARGGCELVDPPTCGPEDERTYPWGEAEPTCVLGNVTGCVGDTDLVGRLSPAGDSPYGLQDMAGNVAEFVADCATTDYLWCVADCVDPVAPECGDGLRLWRGGSFLRGEPRVAYREAVWPDEFGSDYGIRCALSP